jgi:hypothetical protein
MVAAIHRFLCINVSENILLKKKEFIAWLVFFKITLALFLFVKKESCKKGFSLHFYFKTIV